VSEKREQSDRPGKDKIRNPGMNALEKSDRPIVPGKTGNNATERSGAAEPLEGRGRAKEKARQNAMGSTQSGSAMGSGLERLRQRAKEDKNTRFTALLHHVTVDLLRESFLHLQRKSAPGVDGVTWAEYEQGLEGRLAELHGRVHRGSYRAQPSRRVYIPKPDGRKRPLGIASLEDKIVQQAVVVVLNAIYENDFLGFSYGFRPGRKAHDALDALSVALQFEETGWVLDADIQGFFDNMSHEWTMAFLQRRIADPRVLRLIQKWLRAGVSEDGEWSRTTIGTPQGAVISPLLANVYLHSVFDLWAHQWRQEWATGQVFVVRYADDVVVAFQYRGDAVRFQAKLVEQMRAHGLELHPEKTRLIEFGRFAERNRQRSEDGPPDTFDFLGFTHICSRSRNGKFYLKRKTVGKKMRTTLARVKQELLHRMHEPVKETGQWLQSVVTGYYRYFCVPGNLPMMARFRHRVKRLWRRVLICRGGQHKPSWERLTPLFDRWLPYARVLHPYPRERFSAKHPRWEPYAGKPPVRFCPGGAS
jgi:RNA-directed DNA polymerase